MRTPVLVASLLVVVVAACGGSSTDDGGLDAAHADAGPHDLGVTDAAAHDDGTLVDAGLDLGAADASADLGVDAPLPVDLGVDAPLPVDLGVDAPLPVDLGVDAPLPVDLGAADLGGGVTFVLGTPGANCNTTCGGLGLACMGSASVGLACHVHTDIATCDDPANWIYRDNPATKPAPYCRADWGTSEVCGNNYNASNSFCCRCG